jgi:hypothetical protein
MQSGGDSVGLGLGALLGVLLGVLLGARLGVRLGDLLAARFCCCFFEALADPEAFELADPEAFELGDAVGDGSGLGHTRASLVSLLTMLRASDSESAGMPASTCSEYASVSEAIVTSLTSATWCMRTPGTSAWTPR